MLKNTWLVSNVPVHSWARSPFLRNMLLVLFFGNSVHLLQMVGGPQEGKGLLFKFMLSVGFSLLGLAFWK